MHRHAARRGFGHHEFQVVLGLYAIGVAVFLPAVAQSCRHYPRILHGITAAALALPALYLLWFCAPAILSSRLMKRLAWRHRAGVGSRPTRPYERVRSGRGRGRETSRRGFGISELEVALFLYSIFAFAVFLIAGQLCRRSPHLLNGIMAVVFALPVLYVLGSCARAILSSLLTKVMAWRQRTGVGSRPTRLYGAIRSRRGRSPAVTSTQEAVASRDGELSPSS